MDQREKFNQQLLQQKLAEHDLFLKGLDDDLAGRQAELEDLRERLDRLTSIDSPSYQQKQEIDDIKTIIPHIERMINVTLPELMKQHQTHKQDAIEIANLFSALVIRNDSAS